MTEAIQEKAIDWPLRPWVLAGLLGMAGLVVHYAISDWWSISSIEPWRAALAAFAFFGSLALAFTLEKDRWKAPLAFGGIVGLVMAGIAWRFARAGDYYAGAEFWLTAGVVSITLALPLFQAGFHRLRWNTRYEDVHYHIWTNAISAAGAFAFTGLSWILLTLLSELFAAIEINFLRELIRETWFDWLFSGMCFGAALGTLRNQLKIIGTLQSVVMLVFSIIAVPFAVALTVFLCAALLGGIEILWNATGSPTPLLLICAVASFVLVNAVVRNNDMEASGNRVLRIAALALALSILPLAIMAAISAGTRIAEYGLSPERIWGLIAVGIAVVYGAAYFLAPIRGRISGWMNGVRGANMHLAVGTCVLAFLLALPLFDFGAISARNQVARLESGQVPVEKFDFAALRWDFGDAGREALAGLTKSNDAEVARIAKETLAQEERPYHRVGNTSESREERLSNVRMEFEDDALREKVRDIVGDSEWMCEDDCVVLNLGKQADGSPHIAIVENGDIDFHILDSAQTGDNVPAVVIQDGAPQPEQRPDSTVEVREWTGRRIYIDGKPVGDPFK